MSTSGELFTIGQLARRTGMPAPAIRFWSDAGLVPPAGRHRPSRDPGGQRARILAQLEAFTEARVERYWRLLAILNGQPVPSSVIPAFEWLITALRADPS
jgi:hypothetical protein